LLCVDAIHVDPARFHDAVIEASPLLDDAMAVLECRVVQEAEGGDHRVFVGEIIHAETRRQAPCLTLDDIGLQYGG